MDAHTGDCPNFRGPEDISSNEPPPRPRKWDCPLPAEQVPHVHQPQSGGDKGQDEGHYGTCRVGVLGF